MRFSKLKAGNLPGSVAHVARELETPNANPELKNKNITVGASDARAAVLDRVEQITGGKYRKDAVMAYEFIMTAKANWFTGKTGKQLKEWAQASLNWLRKTFGKDNLVSATLHLDEAAPHIHAYVVPEFEGRLCAKAYTGSRKLCSALQTGYANAMKKFGLERGLKGSKAVHIPPKRFHALVNTQEVPELPGWFAGKDAREEYEQSIAMLLAKQKAHTQKYERANNRLAKLLSIIGDRDAFQVRRALTDLETLQEANQNYQLELEETQKVLEEINQAMERWKATLEAHKIRNPDHLDTVLSTAKEILQREQERKYSPPALTEP